MHSNDIFYNAASYDIVKFPQNTADTHNSPGMAIYSAVPL